MSKWPEPYLLEFPVIGESNIGYISVAEIPGIPFEIKRVFWTYYTPQEVIRGRHAHHQLQQVLIAVAGTIKIKAENQVGNKLEFLLDRPSQGVYIPPDYWHTMQYSHTAVQITLASMPYTETDYIRDYTEWLKLIESAGR